MLIFKGDYDKGKFYSLMGKFFAERVYKRLMPYLANDDNTTWYVENKGKNVLGFISYIEKSSKISIGYCYVIEEYSATSLEHNLINTILTEFPTKDTYAEIEKTFDKSVYLDLGFEIYKETTNYWYLVKKVQNENI